MKGRHIVRQCTHNTCRCYRLLAISRFSSKMTYGVLRGQSHWRNAGLFAFSQQHNGGDLRAGDLT